ncbi:MAG: hypothetical protein IJ148_04470 [Bacteroidaceae bacterium]|nr:hypothetical protein [Bacteroidaceae bacterium]
MKEKILSLSFSFLFAWNIGLHADNIISVNEVSIRPGSTAELIVSLENDADFKVYAYDFRLYLPDGIEVDTKANGSYNFTLKERNEDHSTNVQMTSDGAIQFGVNSPTLYLTGNSGPVLGIILKASAGLAEGTYQASIERITYANKEAQTVHPVNITFDIEVRNLVVLDENSTIMPEATNGTVDVNVLRTIRGGNWQTIVLPFAMTEEQVTDVFGDDVELADFAGYETQENEDEEIVGIKVNFNTITSIEANHPCIIKVSQDISSFSVEDVIIEEPEVEPTVAAVKRTKRQWSELIGTYVAQTEVPENTLFLNSNKFYYSDGTIKMKGYRAYFDFYDLLTEIEDGAGVKMFFNIDDEETGIKVIDQGQRTKDDIYDLSGRKIAQKQQKGIYIVNGKKVVIK